MAHLSGDFGRGLSAEHVVSLVWARTCAPHEKAWAFALDNFAKVAARDTVPLCERLALGASSSARWWFWLGGDAHM